MGTATTTATTRTRRRRPPAELCGTESTRDATRVLNVARFTRPHGPGGVPVTACVR